METNDLPPLADGETVEKIDKAALTPLYKTDHTHYFEKDPDDETDDYFAEICIVEGCNLGRLISKLEG